VFPDFWKILFWQGLFLIFYLFSIRQIYRLKAGFEMENRTPAPAAEQKELKI
jgi:hypothetical protein